jgi:hypothetical protein
MSSFPELQSGQSDNLFSCPRTCKLRGQGQTISWERLTIAQVDALEPYSLLLWDWDLANLERPDDSCNSTALASWGSLAKANSMLAPTHQSSQRWPVSIVLRDYQTGHLLSRWFNVPNLLAWSVIFYSDRSSMCRYSNISIHLSLFRQNHLVDKSFKSETSGDLPLLHLFFQAISCWIQIGRRFGVETVKASWIALEISLIYEYLLTAVAAGLVGLCCILSLWQVWCAAPSVR